MLQMWRVLALVASCVVHVSGSGCPLGWFTGNGSCYLFPQGHRANFIEAEHFCQLNFDSHLVQVETAAENAFIKQELRTIKGEFHWLGLTDEESEGTFQWYNGGTDPTFTDWYPNEPNDLHGSEDCVMFDVNRDHQWTDVACGRAIEPICELHLDEEVSVG